MNNLEKYENIFMECLSTGKEDLNETLVYQSNPSWDSVGHMELMSEIEDAFDVMLETDDIINFSSFAKGKEILGKYGIEF